MKPTNTQLQRTLASLASAALLLACSSNAATYQWTNTASSAAFVNAANWTNTASPFGNGVPATGDTGINGIAGSSAVIGTGDLVLAGTLQASAGTFSVTDGELNATTAQATGSNGTFNVSGGVVNLANLQISANYGVISISGGNTTVTTDSRIAAANAVWNVSGGTLNVSKFTIGSASTSNTNNVVTLSGNAVVTQMQGSGGGANRELWIGGNNGGSGTLILEDNASWTSSAANGSTDVIIGRAASGSQSPVGVLTVQDNASFVVQSGNAAAKVIRMADNSSTASGTVNLNGGTISSIGFQRISGTATINANGGRLTALAAAPSFFRNFGGTGGANSINLLAGGLTFDTSFFAIGITNVLSGAGGLTKLGFEVLTLSASNTYTGPTVVNEGTLTLSGTGSISASSAVTANAGSKLDVSAATGPVVFGGALTLNDANLAVNLASTNLTAGSLTLTGTANQLTVTALPAFTTLPGTVHLIKYSTGVSGDLSTVAVALPPVGSPLGYLTNNTASQTVDLIITNMVLKPVIAKQPIPDSAYTNFSAHFSVELEATNSPGYQWRRDGVVLGDNSIYSGATTAFLQIRNVSAAEIGNYDVVVTNVSGAVTSAPAPLSLLAPLGYEAAAVDLQPAALYMFDDQGDPATGNAPNFDYAGDLDGVYGPTAQNGNPAYAIAGPRPLDGLPGFDATNSAARFFGLTQGSHATMAPLNLNTNTVTLAGWINPVVPAANAGLIFCRGGGTVAGLNFSGGVDALGYRTLGYTWHDEAGTYNWNSGIAPMPAQWSFVALVITPTNATIYIFDAAGLRASSQTYTHVNQSFAVSGLIGDDGFSGGNRQFDGSVDGVCVYAKALSQSQLETLYAAGSGVSTFAPRIWLQPATQSYYEQQTATLTVAASGTEPLSYQWQKFNGVTYENLASDARIGGVTSPTLTISNLALTDAGDYLVVVTNVVGSATSDLATLMINPVGPAEAITNSIVQTAGNSWETPSAWSDGLPASVSAASKPGSTYHVVPGGGLRTPNTAANTAFPGNVLTIYGNGTYDQSVINVGGLIIKGVGPGQTYFKKLVMNGGNIFSYTDNNSPTIITGELNVVANTPIAGLTTSGGRSITIAGQLTGTGTVEYRGFTDTTFQPTYVTALNVSGTNNTFSGTWNVISGTLVGSAPGSLGTNNITVGAAGAVQASYNMGNSNAALVLNGRFNLTHNHAFKSVTVNGASLNTGTHTFAELNAASPTNFPATWTGQTGAESLTTGAGSITVLAGNVIPIPLTNTWNGTTLTLSWPTGWELLEATNVAGPWTTNSAAASPFDVVPAEPQKFFRLQAQ